MSTIIKITCRPDSFCVPHGYDLSALAGDIIISATTATGASYDIPLSECDCILNDLHPYIASGDYGHNTQITIHVGAGTVETHLLVTVLPRPDPIVGIGCDPFTAFFGDSVVEIAAKCGAYYLHESGRITPVGADNISAGPFDPLLIEQVQEITISLKSDVDCKTETEMTLIAQNKIIKNPPLEVDENETIMMVSILPPGTEGIYATDGADVVPIGTDIKNSAGWSVVHVAADGTETEIPEYLWTVVGATTDRKCVTRPAIVARWAGKEHVCYRAVTVLPVAEIPQGGSLTATPKKTEYALNSDFDPNNDVDVYYCGNKIEYPAWSYLGFDSSAVGKGTITIVYDPEPEEIGRVITTTYTYYVEVHTAKKSRKGKKE